MPKKCKLWFCNVPAYARGYCRAHYTNWERYGVPVSPYNRDAVSTIKRLHEIVGGNALSPVEVESNEEIYKIIIQNESGVKL